MADISHFRHNRKSQPVKNAVFVGAANKERSRLHELGNNRLSERPSRDDSVKSNNSSCHGEQNGYENKRFSRHPRLRDRLNNSEIIPRMSTPMGRDRSSLRPTRRKASGVENSNISLAGLPDVANRRFHPKYDPYIEIRRARERLSQYKTKGDWAADMLLSDDADEDLHRYEDKLKRRCSLNGEFIGEIELERRQVELLRRQRDIDTGKVTDQYAEYVLTVPKPDREKHHPRTPNKFRQVSRRAWDGMIKKWRKHLHNINNLDFNETWRSLSTDISMSSVNSSRNSDRNSLNNSSDETDGKYDVLSNLPSLKVKHDKNTNWSNRRGAPEPEEEDTLQGINKLVTGNQPPGFNSDEETLHATEFKHNLRHRPINHEKEHWYAPALDILHSGLTNDMYGLSNKRASNEKSVSKQEMLTPTKRNRRSSGTTPSPGFWRSSGKLKSPR